MNSLVHSYLIRLTWLSSLILLIYPHSAAAASLASWLPHPPYSNGTLDDEIKCYSLPYGGIGFGSHVLTYYTIASLSLQRHPWAPWRRNRRSGLDVLLTIISLVVTIIVSAVTMLRCRRRWQFIAIAAWKLDLSITLGILSLHAAAITRRYKYAGKDESQGGHHDSVKVLFWLLLYIPGVTGGMAGILSLVGETIRTNHDVMVITAVFGGVTLAASAVVGIVVCCNGSRERISDFMFASGLSAFAVALACLGVLGAFYSDWILAAIAKNMVGAPSTDNAALYWSYFAAKRLPFFSS